MSFLTDVYGSKPGLPSWQRLNLGTEQRTAVDSNIAIAPEASKLANLTEDQILSMLRTAIPNFDQIRETAGGNIESMLKGEIPKDVQEQITNSAAGRNLGLGTAGSGFGRDLVARDLGITSLNLTEKGLSSAESWMASTERMLSPAMATYTSMFITPEQQAQFDVNERNMKFEHDWLGSQINAMPDPGTAGLMHMFDGTTLLGRSAPQQTGQQSPQYGSAAPSSPDAASGWETAGANDWNITSDAMDSGASDAAVGGAAASGAADMGMMAGML